MTIISSVRRQTIVVASLWFHNIRLNQCCSLSFLANSNPMGTQSRAIQTSALTPIVRRRSPRLMAIEATNNDKLLVNDEAPNKDNNRKLKSLEKATASKKFSKKSTAKKMTKTSTTIKKKSRTLLKDTDNKNSVKLTYLPRTREQELKQHNPKVLVVGVDEAGRGPLAGPVVAAAAIITENIDGITDSKKITKEEMREELYEKIKSSPNASWAIAIVEAQRIDEINILQATMEAMTMATSTLVSSKNFIANGGRIMKEASSKIDGSYVVCSNGSDTDVDLDNEPHTQNESSFYALIDGNRVPKELPCQSEAMVKGDSREYAIGAASILAKVTRDRLMREYDLLYPEYELSRHKGYPTAVHMTIVKQLGASPIHRRSFAPLKHMTFDKNGKIVEES